MTLYDIIADLRREHPTPAASRALDMVVAELGPAHDNLRGALAALEPKPVPTGGRPVLDELLARARANGLDDLEYGPKPLMPGETIPMEELDDGTVGIGLLLGLTALIAVALAGFAVAVGVIAAIHSST